MSNHTSTIPIDPSLTSLLDGLIPGYSLVSNFLLQFLGLDVTFIVFSVLVLFGLGAGLKYVSGLVIVFVQTHFVSSIRVSARESSYNDMIDWITEKKTKQGSRSLLIETKSSNRWLAQDEEVVASHLIRDGFLFFGGWQSKNPVAFQPAFGHHYFFHRGRFFLFTRHQQMLSTNEGITLPRRYNYITLSCLGRSVRPLKELWEEARDYSTERGKSCIEVYRPPTKLDRQNGFNEWESAVTRRCRPMHTVVLDKDLKSRVMKDMNEFLHPSSSRWCEFRRIQRCPDQDVGHVLMVIARADSERGIPYRRGYLLYGPPGSGKSSLAWAIAGVFGLGIHVLALSSPNLTEEELVALFTTLPRRCIVLLEDIDSAGLHNRTKLEAAATLKSAQDPTMEGKEASGGISLSGLLNAIDGIASHEGRILIMTTNCPEKLDEALIRPGRVDMKISFGYACHGHIAKIFVSMYTLSTHKKGFAASEREEDGNIKREGPQGGTSLDAVARLDHEELNESEIFELAESFARHIPEDTFTLAEIQGFLLTRKHEPQKALDDVEAWVAHHIATKKSKMEEN